MYLKISRDFKNKFVQMFEWFLEEFWCFNYPELITIVNRIPHIRI